MEQMNPRRPTASSSDVMRGSGAGSIALMILLATVLVVASYPWISLAIAAGAIGSHLARRGVVAFRRRRRGPVRIRETADGSEVWSRSSPK